jgi:hypothetical protein
MKDLIATEFEWNYEPTDFFEDVFECLSESYTLSVGLGKVTAILSEPANPVPDQLRERIEKFVTGLFRARTILDHREFNLDGPRLKQRYSDGSTDYVMFVTAGVLSLSGGRVDFQIINADGQVITDTKQERVARDKEFLSLITPLLPKSGTLKALVNSYYAAVQDPSNELVYLYEIRDALLKEFGGEGNVRRILGLTRSDWSEFGRLCNDAPLLEGRHRGQQINSLRKATEDELGTARRFAQVMIEAYAKQIKSDVLSSAGRRAD